MRSSHSDLCSGWGSSGAPSEARGSEGDGGSRLGMVFSAGLLDMSEAKMAAADRLVARAVARVSMIIPSISGRGIGDSSSQFALVLECVSGEDDSERCRFLRPRFFAGCRDFVEDAALLESDGPAPSFASVPSSSSAGATDFTFDFRPRGFTDFDLAFGRTLSPACSLPPASPSDSSASTRLLLRLGSSPSLCLSTRRFFEAGLLSSSSSLSDLGSCEVDRGEGGDERGDDSGISSRFMASEGVARRDTGGGDSEGESGTLDCG